MNGDQGAKRMLVTGFDPFGGETINPAWEAVARLPKHIGDWEIYPLQVPTVFGRAADVAWQAVERLMPRAVLCVGQAGGRNAVTPEMIAINLRHAGIADNAGNSPKDEAVVVDGPAAYFATLPVRKMISAIAEAGLPVGPSYSAGTFVCNDLMYTMLHRLRDTDVMAGFVHVPFLPQQAKDGKPGMPLEDIVCALCAAIAVC